MVDNPDPYEAGPMVETPETPEIDAEPETMDVAAWLTSAPDQVNLVEFLKEDQRAEIAQLVAREHDIDRKSMKPWLEAMEAGLKMAHDLERGEKSWPWPKASDIRYPLVLTAALQFNARAYPAIVPPDDVVKVRTHGADAGGEKRRRGDRVSAFMSWQCRAQISEWEPSTDRLTMLLPIVGTMVRKWYWSPAKQRPCVRLVKPGDFIINDAVDALENAPRMGEEIRLYPAEIIERQRTGEYVDGGWWEADKEDTAAPVEFIEQHRLYDVDGDGYPEPYVCILHKESETLVRMAANWAPEDVTMGADGRAVSIERRDYYEDFHFVRWTGFWSMGLGLLLRDISETIDATINRINDAATAASLGGGFIGGEARLRGGPVRLRPGEWQQVSALGGDLRAAMVPANFPGPSPVLFQMLGLLLDAGREIANVKDIAGEAQRANQPATTTMALIEQGMAVFTAVYKRIHHTLKGEFRRLGELNVLYGDPQQYAIFHDEPADLHADFNAADMDIEPVADPRAVTSPQKMAQAQLLNEMAAAGMIPPEAARDRMLDAAGIADGDDLRPPPDPMAGIAQESALRAAMLGNVKLALEIAELEAKIADIHASATKKMAEAEAADPMNPVNIALAQVEALKGMVDADRRRLEGMAQAPGDGGLRGGAPQAGGGGQGPGVGELLALGGSGPEGMGAGSGGFQPL